MSIRFTKLISGGSDYICVDGLNTAAYSLPLLARQCLNRRKGVGGDGMILIHACKVADAEISVYSPQGLCVAADANAILCACEYLFTHKGQDGLLAVKTERGIYRARRIKQGNWSINLGLPIFEPCDIPLRGCKSPLINTLAEVGGGGAYLTALSLQGTHCAAFSNDVAGINLPFAAPAYSCNSIFPKGAHTEFIQVISNTMLKIRIWKHPEEAYASGTCAAAALAAAVACGKCDKGSRVSVLMQGGEAVQCMQESEGITLTGDSLMVFAGEIGTKEQ